MKINLKKHQLTCQRCGYKWLPRLIEVRLCPRCKTAHWEVARKKKSNKGESK